MELPTYTGIWRIEKRLYKLYDFRLPMPLPVGQIAVFAAITVPYIILLTLFGLPFNHNLFWLCMLPPGLLTCLGTQLKRKRLPELLKCRLCDFDDFILLTETHAWAYYRLPTHAYEFTTPAEREALAINITVALAAIRLPDAEVHLRVAHRSYPAADWAARLDATSDGGPGWRGYLDEMYQHVWSKDFWAKEVYLGVRLGQRGMRAQLSGGVFSQFINVYRASEQALGLGDGAVSAAEIGRWTEQAERPGRPRGGR